MNKFSAICLSAVAACLLSTGANAQSRGEGWEFGADVVFQMSQDFDGDNGTSVDFEDDVGLSLDAGYRLSDRFEVHFGLDWSNVGYDAQIVPQNAPNTVIGVSGDMETFTPFVKGQLNFLEGPITPFVTAGLGWSFVDTNIPDGLPQTGCWWDPWYGQICSTFQDTKTTDGFSYSVGLGLRWDLSPGYSLRASYEKHWYDVENADLDFDQAKLGIVFRY